MKKIRFSRFITIRLYECNTITRKTPKFRKRIKKQYSFLCCAYKKYNIYS